MFTKRLMLITTVCSIVFLAGCGTIGARATTKNPPPFAGLRSDFTNLGYLFTNKEEIKPVWMYGMVVPLVSGIILADIPVSAFFDLYCLPADLSRHKEHDEKLDITIEKSSSDSNEGYIQGSTNEDSQNLDK